MRLRPTRSTRLGLTRSTSVRSRPSCGGVAHPTLVPRFSWERFLRAHGIDHEFTRARQVEVSCPFCGPDHSNHRVSINLDGRGWRCWRQPHVFYGRSPVQLVQALARCSREEALRIVGDRGALAPPPTGDLMVAKRAQLFGRPAMVERPRHLELPPEAHPLTEDDPRAGPFWDYLEERGYRPSEARWLVRTYDLHWAVSGPWRWRLIFPVRGRRGELLTWTARAIGRDVEPRYRQPPDEVVRTRAPDTLWGLDCLWAVSEPRVLVVCEGPLDAARISVSGAPLGVWGTCLFGLGLSDAQRHVIFSLTLVDDRWPRMALLLDAGKEAERRRMARRLVPLDVETPSLPVGVDDPGELTAAQASRLCMDILAGV